VAGIDRSVFKSYDIRGTYPDQLDDQFAYLLGRALPGILPAERVAVGHDARLSSPSLYAAFATGLAHAGVQVAGMGLCPTELVYYVAGSEGGPDLGVMITASHNPPEYNGFKVVRAGGDPVPATGGLDQAAAWMEAMSVSIPAACARPAQACSVEDAYVDFALDLVGRPDVGGLRIVVDAGSGVGGLLWDPLSERLGMDSVRLYFEPDGSFPGHLPDPSRLENLGALIEAVAEERADAGFCYDGDADRVVAVLRDGHVVDGSETTACIAERFLSRHLARAREGEVVFGVGQTISRKVLDYFREHGVEPVMLPVGHAKIKRLMRDRPRMVFAGEDVGHYYYRDFFCCDSSLITTLHLLHVLSEGKLGQLVRSLPGPWHRPAGEPRFGFADKRDASATCRRVAQDALRTYPEPVEISCESDGRVNRRCGRSQIAHADGVRVDYADWWFCVRPSGTEPVARLVLEAREPDLLAERTELLSGLFKRPALS